MALYRGPLRAENVQEGVLTDVEESPISQYLENCFSSVELNDVNSTLIRQGFLHTGTREKKLRTKEKFRKWIAEEQVNFSYTSLLAQHGIFMNPLKKNHLLQYRRNHPIYPNWSDWSDTVHLYYNKQTSLCLHKLVEWGQNFAGGLEVEVASPNNYLAYLFTRINDHFHGLLPKFRAIAEKGQGFLECYDTIIREVALEFETMENVPLHGLDNERRSIYISAVILYLHFFKKGIWARNMLDEEKMYYVDLLRTLLVIPIDETRHFDLQMVFDYKKFFERKNPLIYVFYSKSWMDNVNVLAIAQMFEKLKHSIPTLQLEGQYHTNIAEEQGGGVSQCRSAFTPDFWNLCEKCVAQEQGYLVDHKVSIEDGDWVRLRQMLEMQRHEFVSSFGDMLTRVAFKTTSLFLTATVIACLIRYSCDASYKMLLNILNMLYRLISGDDDGRHCAVEQAGGISIPFLPAFFVNNVIGPPANVLKRLWNTSSVDTTMRRIGFIGDLKIERGIERITNWIKTAFKKTYAWFLYQAYGIVQPDDLDSESHAVKNWLMEVDQIVEQYYNQELHWNETTWGVVYNLYSRGLTLSRTPAYQKEHRAIWNILRQLSNILEQFKSHNKDGNTIRNPPVTIYLSGGTGTGKSSLTYPLAASILKNIFKTEPCNINLRENWKSFIYSRASEQEFWDGYENQLITVFDDYSQRADSTSNPNLELFEIIRASNCFPYPLHMAAIEQKANTVFSSKIIIVSSNQDKPQTASLNFPDALYRRFDVAVRVQRNTQGKLSSPKFDPTQYTFTLYDIQTDKNIRQISYDELALMCTSKYLERKNYVESIETYIDSMFDDSPTVSTEQGWMDYFNRTHETEPDLLDPEEFVDALLEQEGLNSPEQNFSCIRECIKEAKERFFLMDSWWTNFRAEHPYLITALQALCYISVAIGLLKAFRSIWDSLTKVTQGFRKPKVSEKKLATEPFQHTVPEEVRKRWIENPLAPGGPATPYAIYKYGWNACMPYNYARPETYCPAPTKAKQEGPSTHWAQAPYMTTPAGLAIHGWNATRPWQTSIQEGYGPSAPTVPLQESPMWFQTNPYTDLPTPVGREQGVKDLNTSEIISSSIRGNLYKIGDLGTGSVFGHVLFLRGNVCLFPKHFIRALKETVRRDADAILTFQSCLLRRAFEMPMKDFIRESKSHWSPDEEEIPVVTRDLMSCAVHGAIIHKDITTAFVPRSALRTVGKTEVALPILVKGGKGESNQHLLIRYRNATGSLSVKESLPVGNPIKTIARFIRDAWRYEADTEVTECGAPLLVRNKDIQPGKICGIHVAGIAGTGEGFSTPVYREDIVDILASHPDSVLISIEQSLPLRETVVSRVPESAEMLRLGSLDAPVVQPTKTKIEKSLVHGRITKPKTKPCVLFQQRIDGKIFDPRAYRLGRLGNVPCAIGRDIVQIAKRALVEELAEVITSNYDAFIDDNLKPEYTMEETVKGIPGDDFVNAVKRTTSPGYPWIQKEGCKTRVDFFGNEEEYRMDSPQFAQLDERVKEIILKAKQGIAMEHVFVDTLKDERKPIEKAHKTRLFSAGPLCYLIACKKYFNGIVALLQRARSHSHISVGTNVYSRDWDAIATHLLRKSGHMVAGDFEGFDASQHALILEAAGEVLIELSKLLLGTNDEQAKIMWVLLQSLFSSVHIVHDNVVRWTHSLPSGHYLTAIINSIFVNLAFCIVWMLAHYQSNVIFARSFWRECGIVAYGDDHIVSIPANRLEIFNQKTLVKLFLRIGLIYTMEDKGTTILQQSRKLTEISYLKRGFSFDKDRMRWIAPLSIDTITETPMWCHKTPDKHSQTIENLEWALRELSLHNAVTWGQWKFKFYSLLNELGKFPQATQEELRSSVLD